MLIAIGSLKASPGVTTTALAVAAVWPSGGRVLVVEADPAGGDVAARFALEPGPGLVSLSAAARHEHEVAVAFEHAQELPGGLPVVTAPSSAEQSTSALDLVTGDGAPLWANIAADPDVVVIADCGRLDAGSPAHGLLAAADVALLVVRPNLAECHRLAGRLDALAVRAEATGTELGLVLCGPGFEQPQVEESMRMRVWAQLPQDVKAAALLSGESGRRRGLAGLDLPKAARALGTALAEHDATHRALVPAARPVSADRSTSIPARSAA
ncbi:MAG TPA: hypothetical protein VGX23_18775 [Actinocrinis sp.]|nr:hypothetical protein [Actinocrinis sp.]